MSVEVQPARSQDRKRPFEGQPAGQGWSWMLKGLHGDLRTYGFQSGDEDRQDAAGPQRTKGLGQAKKQLPASCWSESLSICICAFASHNYMPINHHQQLLQSSDAIEVKVHDCAAQVRCQFSSNLARLQQTSSWQLALRMPGVSCPGSDAPPPRSCLPPTLPKPSGT